MRDGQASAPEFPIDSIFDRALQTKIDQIVAGLFERTAATGMPALALARSIDRLLTGGKRLRPRLALWSWLGHTSEAQPSDLTPIATLGASLECFQAAALLHDDLIDRSSTRRGLPTAHVEFESTHRTEGRVGSPTQFGSSAALLAGDLALIAAQSAVTELFHYVPADAPVPHHVRNTGIPQVVQLWQNMTIEVTAGQFLDLTAQSLPNWGVDSAADQELSHRVIVAKSARYSVELPLVMGAALAGAATVEQQQIAAFGRPLGEAFQLRDDLLGVFGDPSITGKPSGDDIREGKRTILMAITAERATDLDRQRLTETLNTVDVTDDDVSWVSDLVHRVGAHTEVESIITSRYNDAMEALSQCDIEPRATARLGELAQALSIRTT